MDIDREVGSCSEVCSEMGVYSDVTALEHAFRDMAIVGKTISAVKCDMPLELRGTRCPEPEMTRYVHGEHPFFVEFEDGLTLRYFVEFPLPFEFALKQGMQFHEYDLSPVFFPLIGRRIQRVVVKPVRWKLPGEYGCCDWGYINPDETPNPPKCAIFICEDAQLYFGNENGLAVFDRQGNTTEMLRSELEPYL